MLEQETHTHLVATVRTEDRHRVACACGAHVSRFYLERAWTEHQDSAAAPHAHTGRGVEGEPSLIVSKTQ